jgi:hypothetical protein
MARAYQYRYRQGDPTVAHPSTSTQPHSNTWPSPIRRHHIMKRNTHSGISGTLTTRRKSPSHLTCATPMLTTSLFATQYPTTRADNSAAKRTGKNKHETAGQEEPTRTSSLLNMPAQPFPPTLYTPYNAPTHPKTELQRHHAQF